MIKKLKNTKIFEGTPLEVTISENGELLLELYSTGMDFGHDIKYHQYNN
ncbi:MAG: hypothetical protein KIC67_15735 [Clostridium butyricum]|nr:hypothetical protein [Clostridium butyricum]